MILSWGSFEGPCVKDLQESKGNMAHWPSHSQMPNAQPLFSFCHHGACTIARLGMSSGVNTSRESCKALRALDYSAIGQNIQNVLFCSILFCSLSRILIKPLSQTSTHAGLDRLGRGGEKRNNGPVRWLGGNQVHGVKGESRLLHAAF